MILSVLFKLYIPITYIFTPLSIETFGYSDFLINFSGGFVRRGLLGEILHWISSTTGANPKHIITLICVIAYVGVTWVFFRLLKRKGYCWWILLSPLLCGLVYFVIRKDYTLYLILIGVCYLLRNGNPAPWQRLSAFVLSAMGLMLHEAFIFWGLPMIALILLNERKHRFINVGFIVFMLALFGLLCIYKGSPSIASAITESWKPFAPEFHHGQSIDALAWQLKDTALFHLWKNLGAGYFGMVYWPLCFIVVYYFITFFFSAFQPAGSRFGHEERTNLSCTFLFTSICMLPMFAFLSCDYGRLFQYITIASFAIFFIIHRNVQERLFPCKIKNVIARFNSIFESLLPPSKGLLAVLLLTIGISPFCYDIYFSMVQSPLGVFGQVFIKILFSGYEMIKYSIL